MGSLMLEYCLVLYSQAFDKRCLVWVKGVRETELGVRFEVDLMFVVTVNVCKRLCSPLPEGKYEFSTLWGGYVSGSTQKLQVSFTSIA